MSTVNEINGRLTSGGDCRELLHVSRYEVVEYLCGERGHTLLSFLLEVSVLDARQQRAVVWHHRLRDIAVKLRWSPDTVKRYIAVFRAVNLVQHYHDYGREVKFFVPLGPYTPLSSLDALDEVCTKREKLRQLAQKVKRRYLERFGDLSQDQSEDMQTCLREIKTLFENERLAPLKRERLHLKIAEMLAPHFQEKGDSNTPANDAPTSQGRPPETSLAGDANEERGAASCTQETSQARESIVKADTSVDVHQQIGDQQAEQSNQATHTDSHEGDSMRSAVPEVGDGETQTVTEVQADAPYTYNVYYIISNLNTNSVIRKQIAQFFAGVLETNKYENGYPTFSKYLKAFKDYSPEVIGRAFLATMVLLHRKRWQVKSAGATFTKQCKVLSGQLPFAHYTLDEVEEWLKTWGNLPYSELPATLGVSEPAPAAPQPASLVVVSRSAASPTSAGTVPERSWSGYARTSSYSGKRTYGMQYTGRPVCINRSTNNLGSCVAPGDEYKLLSKAKDQ